MNKITQIISILFALIILSSFSYKTTSKYNQKLTPTINTVDGKAVFIANGCTVCHTNSANSIGPKISVIAKAYHGKKEQLVKFLKREAKPIVAPEEFAMMNAFLLNTKKLDDKGRLAIAKYILSSK